MRFLMINLVLICLLLFGITYLAFSDTEAMSKPDMDFYVPFHEFVDKDLHAESNCPTPFLGRSGKETDLIK